MKSYISIDQGTTSSRSIIFRADGKILSIHQKEFRQFFPNDGWVEHDPEEIWNTTKNVVSKSIDDGIKNNWNLCAIGITNQRETIVIWDKVTGKPVYNAIVWQDRRTADLCDDLKKNNYETFVSDKTGLLLDPYFSATKIKWLLDNVENLRKKATNGKLLCGTIDSFLIWRLTGGQNHYTDATNAARTSLYNIHDNVWDEELLKLFNIPLNIMPKVLNSADNFGICNFDNKITLPILSSIGDQQSAAIGQACLSSGSIKSTYGTGCFVILNTGKNIIKSKNRLLSTICYKINNETTYALEGSIFIAGAVVQWLRDNMKFITKASETENISSKMIGNNGIYLVPAFTGLGAPWWDPNARGSIFGIKRETSPNDIIRASLESVAYQTNDLFNAMEKDGIKPNLLNVDGGMSENNWLMQFLANILNINVQRPKILETTALGASMLAALMDGHFSNLSDISNNWSLDRTFTPNIENKKRKELLYNWNLAVNKTIL